MSMGAGNGSDSQLSTFVFGIGHLISDRQLVSRITSVRTPGISTRLASSGTTSPKRCVSGEGVLPRLSRHDDDLVTKTAGDRRTAAASDS